MKSIAWRRRPGASTDGWRAAVELVAVLVFSAGWLASGWGAEERMVLRVEAIPANGLVVARVDLSVVAQWCRTEVVPERLRVFRLPDDRELPAQFVPDDGRRATGTLVLRCPTAASPILVRLDFSGAPDAAKETPRDNHDSGPAAPPGALERRVRVVTGEGTITIQTPWYAITHDAGKQGGFPATIVFSTPKPRSIPLQWHDRLYHREAGQYGLRYDSRPRLQCVATGALCTVVRLRAAYARPDGQRPESRPAAVYDWFYFRDQPLVYVRARVEQATSQLWHEAHFLELHFRTNAFGRWLGGAPPQSGAFVGDNQSHRFGRWAAVTDGRHALGMFAAGDLAIYDGRDYGPYLHALVDAAWRSWDTLRFERAAWLWIGADADPAGAISRAAAAAASLPRVTVRTERLQERLRQLRAQLEKAAPADRAQFGWPLAVTRLLEQQGQWRAALELPPARLPERWQVIRAGDLRLVLERRPQGIALVELIDAANGTLLLGAPASPLFQFTLRHAETGRELRLSSDNGWEDATIEAASGNDRWVLQWRKPQDEVAGPLIVTARLRCDGVNHRLAWSLTAAGQRPPWSLWQVQFPALTLAPGGAEAQLLLPQAAGVLRPVGRAPLKKFTGQYPSGWMAMPLAALYDPAAGTGLYFGLHDPVGATRNFTAENVGNPRAVRLAWDIPVPDMGRAGNRFELSGEAVWQLLRGDWFDAALIYRAWARREAKWYPRLDAAGRPDTPRWMRELSVWAMTGGAPGDCVPQVLAFAQALGVPVGFHWYRWHRIPFDNDYPHYFPARDGLVEGVQRLQSAGVHVMPYINGRLWDTHDRGAGDFQFTRLARAAATKDARGMPYLETYGSKETNGAPVRLAVMCPTTKLWRERVGGIVRRLFDECGVHAVYIDQVAAAKPMLCFDAAHGHPLGGGSWWTEQGYWPLLEAIRTNKPADRVLTTECNAEPFLRWFDGYLTWHWQYDGQVPLFPAVYGGAIQMFGRAYRGGPTKDLALRMKVGQQLVWGEQLGWLHPNVVNETNNFPFFRDAVRLRWRLRRYFYAGQMARPPKLGGEVPSVTADWRWSGTWPVTTPAVMTGAWHRPADNRLVLLFANVTDQPVIATVQYDLRQAGLKGERFDRHKWLPAGASAAGEVGPQIRETVTFPARSVWAWELSSP